MKACAGNAWWRPAVAVALMIALNACTTTGKINPVSQLPPAEAAHIPDAVPQAEPLSKNGNPAFYDALGQRYFVMSSAAGYEEQGVASWYGPGFHEGNTSSGERYDMYGMTAAHRTLPLPTYVQVTNLSNGKSVVVRVNDRGPFKKGRIIDLSYAAAAKLDMLRDGTAFVDVKALVPGGSVPATDTVSADTHATTMFIQAGAFSAAANAERLLNELRQHGHADAFIRNDVVKGQPLYRVRIGPISTVDQFDTLVAQLKSLGINDAHLALD
ncbi:MAG: septal ring lytic transglycosylase RlpA family protein [Steroidobacter sp.]